MARLLALVLLAAVAAAPFTAALTTPHGRDANHLAIAARLAARVAEPVPVPAPADSAIAPRGARLSRRRCPVKATSTTAPAAASSSAAANIEAAPSSSSHAAAPAASSQKPSTAAQPPPQSSSAPPPPTGTGCAGQSLASSENSGDGTFYATGLGACGITNNDNQHIVAVSQFLYDTYPGYTPGGNPNNNPICGKQIQASYGGNSVVVTVTDRCTGCNCTSLDFAPSAFNILADPALGRIHGMVWHWL